MDLFSTVILFRDMLTVERCLSKNTVNNYILDIQNFLKYTNGAPNKQSFHGYVRDKAYSITTIARKSASLLAWIKFCETDLMVNVELELPKLKSPTTIPKVLSNKDMHKMTEYLRTTQNEFGIKMLAVIEFLYSTGLRVSEMMQIRINQWEEMKGQKKFNVIGKGNKERTVFVSQSAIEALEPYLKLYSTGSEYIFRTRTGKQLNRQSIHRQLKLVAKKAHVSLDRVFPHSFRHRLGSNLNQKGMNLAEIKEILGHKRIKTTLIYTHLEDEWMMDSVRTNHPLEKR